MNDKQLYINEYEGCIFSNNTAFIFMKREQQIV